MDVSLFSYMIVYFDIFEKVVHDLSKDVDDLRNGNATVYSRISYYTRKE